MENQSTTEINSENVSEKEVSASQTQYNWNPDTLFTFTGNEFGFIINQLLAEEKQLLDKLNMINIFKQKLLKGVEEGAIKAE